MQKTETQNTKPYVEQHPASSRAKTDVPCQDKKYPPMLPLLLLAKVRANKVYTNGMLVMHQTTENMHVLWVGYRQHHPTTCSPSHDTLDATRTRVEADTAHRNTAATTGSSRKISVDSIENESKGLFRWTGSLFLTYLHHRPSLAGDGVQSMPAKANFPRDTNLNLATIDFTPVTGDSLNHEKSNLTIGAVTAHGSFCPPRGRACVRQINEHLLLGLLLSCYLLRGAATKTSSAYYVVQYHVMMQVQAPRSG